MYCLQPFLFSKIGPTAFGSRAEWRDIIGTACHSLHFSFQVGGSYRKWLAEKLQDLGPYTWPNKQDRGSLEVY